MYLFQHIFNLQTSQDNMKATKHASAKERVMKLNINAANTDAQDKHTTEQTQSEVLECAV